MRDLEFFVRINIAIKALKYHIDTSVLELLINTPAFSKLIILQAMQDSRHHHSDQIVTLLLKYWPELDSILARILLTKCNTT
ncbi:MAG: hypothetical protein H0U75_05110 [Legionella sp.]|nr:hypothetical protein [Legionella sp.]